MKRILQSNIYLVASFTENLKYTQNTTANTFHDYDMTYMHSSRYTKWTRRTMFPTDCKEERERLVTMIDIQREHRLNFLISFFFFKREAVT